MTLMRKLVATMAVLLGSLALASPAQQRHPTPIAVEAVAATPVLRPALWKVADADTTIYLFGTIHALPANVDWLNGDVANALEASDELVSEIINPDALTLQRVILEKSVLPSGQILRGMLSPGERSAYEEALKRNNLPVETFDRYKPWYAAISLVTLTLARDGVVQANGVEEGIRARAAALKLPHRGLETFESQIALFDGLPHDAQLRLLNEAVAGDSTIGADLAAIVKEWSTGQAERLADLVNADEDDPAMVGPFLLDRNRKWAEWIKARLDHPGTVFMAVGAGHLGGPVSVQDQLAARGIATTRVQ